MCCLAQPYSNKSVAKRVPANSSKIATCAEAKQELAIPGFLGAWAVTKEPARNQKRTNHPRENGMPCPKLVPALASMGMAIAKTIPLAIRRQNLAATRIAKHRTGKVSSTQRVQPAQPGIGTTCHLRGTRPTTAKSTRARKTGKGLAPRHDHREAAIGIAHPHERIAETPDETMQNPGEKLLGTTDPSTKKASTNR